MVDITLQGPDVLFSVKGLHKFWALRSQLLIPRSHIRGARRDADVLKGWWKGWRAPGTHIPGLLTAGTFYQEDRRIFWDVHNADNAIIIDLEHDEYDQLIIEVADPDAMLAILTAATTA